MKWQCRHNAECNMGLDVILAQTHGPAMLQSVGQDWVLGLVKHLC